MAKDVKVDAVVIGASAGALLALGGFLPHLPANFPAPVLVVVHLRAQTHSLLPELFRQRCALHVCEAQDKLQLEPGTIYFAPPDYHLLVEFGGTLALSVDDPVNYSRPSIDVLFESAAEVFGARLLALILTGANHDGARGAAEIRRCGGIVAVQDPNTAEAPQMPRFAIESAEPQCVGTIPELVTFTLRTVCG